MNNLAIFDESIMEAIFDETINDMFFIGKAKKEVVKGILGIGKYVDATKMWASAQAAFDGEMTAEEFRMWLDDYGHKTHFIEFIEKQRRSQHIILNVMCGTIAKDAFKNKRVLNQIEMNHIECLLGLNLTDIHNCMDIWKCIEENIQLKSKSEDVVSRERCKSMMFLETTRSKLAYHGYLKTDMMGHLIGDIVVNNLFFDLIRRINQVYQLYIKY